MAKFKRGYEGPGWGEVIFAALLSAALGVVLGAGLLLVRPVTVVKALPPEAERDPDMVYYIEGSRETARSREAPPKRAAFVGGQSVTLNEDELNALAGALNRPTESASGEPSKSGPKGATSAESGMASAAGSLNFRLHDDRLQFGVPVTVGVLGVDRKILVQGQGSFVKNDGVFVYAPSEIYLGSLPLARLPWLAGRVRTRLLDISAIPDDLKAAWAKLANVAVEGSALKLTMP